MNLSSICRYLRYLTRITRLSFLRIYYYPRDFIWFVFMIPVFLASELGGLYFLFYTTNFQPIGGVTPFQIFFVTSFSVLLWMLSSLSTLSSGDLGGQIHSGELDTLLLLPLPPALTMWGHFIFVKKFILLFVRITLISLLLLSGQILLDVHQWLQLFFIAGSFLLLFHGLYITAETLSFWFPKLNLSNYLHELHNLSLDYPPSIYPEGFRLFFTFLIPIFLMGFPTYSVLTHSYTWTHVGVTSMLCLFWLACARITLHHGLRRYESAN